VARYHLKNEWCTGTRRMIRSPGIEGTNAVSDCQSGRFLDRYLGARVPGNPSRDDVLAALREHVYLTVMLGYERDDSTMTELHKGVLVEASRNPGTWEKADRFALVTPGQQPTSGTFPRRARPRDRSARARGAGTAGSGRAAGAAARGARRGHQGIRRR
jgi:hypothetical protein